jgi:hypothetical protein
MAHGVACILGRCVLLAAPEGVWNLAAGDDGTGEESALLLAKVTVVAASGATAYLHSHASTARARGLYGAATGVPAVLPLLLAVLLHD